MKTVIFGMRTCVISFKSNDNTVVKNKTRVDIVQKTHRSLMSKDEQSLSYE